MFLEVCLVSSAHVRAAEAPHFSATARALSTRVPSLTHRAIVPTYLGIERRGGRKEPMPSVTRSATPYANDSHELLMGCALGLGLAAMAGFWWVWACLHG